MVSYIQCDDLMKVFKLGNLEVQALRGLSMKIEQGEMIAIVGPSGSGKTTLLNIIGGLARATAGKTWVAGRDITNANNAELGKLRQKVVGHIFQTLNLIPTLTAYENVELPMLAVNTPANERKKRTTDLLERVGLTLRAKHKPDELSGGEKQRVGIARALAGRPDLVLCDEPVSALDVSVQAAVLNLLLEIQAQLGTTMVFIAHDLSVVRFFSDHIAVMYLGKFMEIGAAEAIYAPPYHPYTESLLAAVPVPDPSVHQEHIRLEGNVPSPLNPPSGCPFQTRCPRRSMLPDEGLICEIEMPTYQDAGDGHRILCHIPLEQLIQLDPVIHAPA